MIRTFHHPLRVAAILALLSMAAAIARAEIVWQLKPDEIATLSADARKHYNHAQDEIDRVRYDAGLTLLLKAAEIDTGHKALQLLVSRAFQLRALSKTGEEAKACFANAAKLLNNVLKLPELTDEEKILYAKRLKEIEDDRAKVDERDTRRAKVGQDIVEQIAAEMPPPEESASGGGSGITLSGGLGSGDGGATRSSVQSSNNNNRSNNNNNNRSNNNRNNNNRSNNNRRR